LDSRFNDREQAAVDEWMRSDKSFHIMRDHPAHTTTILAGLFGSKLLNLEIRNQWNKSFSGGLQDSILWKGRKFIDADQQFLSRQE